MGRKTDQKREESPSSRALGELLEELGYPKVTEDTGIHRTQLWRYATGRQKPDHAQIAKLHRAYDGRVAADGWETDLAPTSERVPNVSKGKAS